MPMSNGAIQVPLTLTSLAERMFPRLTPEQIARIAVRGRKRQAENGEVLIEAGERTPRFFVIPAWHIEIVRPVGSREEPVVVCEAGMFTGSFNMLHSR